MNDLTMQELIFLELAAVQRTSLLCEWCAGDEELMQKQKDFLSKIRVKLNAMQGTLIAEDEQEEEPQKKQKKEVVQIGVFRSVTAINSFLRKLSPQDIFKIVDLDSVVNIYYRTVIEE